ncbi:succinate dehydrogenase, hydrophobic membrane anchor protein [Anaplasma marginale]|nr:succinate dehydrogenase, hydrophobic membrane anchor protein [Anaplasma marginale]AXW83857.1 succinate dehydrogenase, hydrophobic membrane anchor protein [Anaplasma marginale]AXW84776.1 succinate dehydrogenase, hydrophobic membrane anchor protein [Anaplasma marginale]KAA8472422.1 succinate dehydrogenase, hydrophobic membrane anchor protein [Anaplasma marginale]KAA8474608.1 succinate dehydrogenase, hydrophobic membrane anchor protein [Anaplasma marginale]KAB0450817.1 succinate dehydrogenase,
MGGRSVYFWWMQRIAGLVMLPVPFLFAFFYRSYGFESVHAADYGFCASVSAIALLVAAFYHGVLGVQVVLEDYVHSEVLRAFMITFFRLFALVTVCAVTLAMLFGHNIR